MTLFAHRRRDFLGEEAPLATRMRPTTFKELKGQDHLVGPGQVLRRAIDADKLPSMILWGPPGTGKTTLAYIIASLTQAHFSPLSAVTAGVADLRRIIEEAEDRLGMHAQKTILFVDEIHRFNRAQQDAILPHIERGTVTFIGATTENPSFEVAPPLLSRARVYALKPLDKENMRSIIQRAAQRTERNSEQIAILLDDQGLDFLVTASGGDARVALNTLELASTTSEIGDDGKKHISLARIKEALGRRTTPYDKKGSFHYDTISAFIKSVRGSAPDAAIYWLARMVDAGEDPLFIARRLVILAAEDIGLADPQALSVAVACQQAVHFIGMPEGAIPLSECTIYLATAPKSNSAYAALQHALEDAQVSMGEPVPTHIRSTSAQSQEQLGYDKKYQSLDSSKGHLTRQDYLPVSLRNQRYYHPTDHGHEVVIGQRLEEWENERTQ